MNSAPTFDGTLGGSVVYAVMGAPVVLDSSVTVHDAELDALNNGAGDYAGASVSLVRHGSASSDDVFGFSTAGAAFTVSGNQLQSGGQTFATYSTAVGQLAIVFTSSGAIATRALVDDVLGHITYTLTGSTPPATVQIDWSFSDGNAGAQGAGGALVANATTTVLLSDPLSSPTSVTLPQPIQALVLTGTANINGTGNSLANSITGNSGNNVLDGGAGADTMVGGPGNDTFVIDDPGDLARDAPPIRIVSTGLNGAQANNFSNVSVISADGRYVAFGSFASNLVPGDTNEGKDVFIRDLETGTIERVSVAADGTQQARSFSSTPAAIFGDGRYVVFSSDAFNLVAGDTNNSTDAFVKDRLTGTIERVSVAANGEQANLGGGAMAISPDGRFVLINSRSTNLVAGDTNWADVFVKDRVTGAVVLASVRADGVHANNDSGAAAFSADGRYVAFGSFATNLVADDTNNNQDIFLKDLVTGTLDRVSVAADGSQTDPRTASSSPSISADGRYVAFVSDSKNLVLGDTSVFNDIFVKDMLTGKVDLVSSAADGTRGNNDSTSPHISADGRYVTFESGAGNLVPGGGSLSSQVYVKDRLTGAIELVSRNVDDEPGTNGHSFSPSLSADGRYLAFESDASNLVSGDTNGEGDIFVTSNTLNPTVSGGVDTVQSSISYALGTDIENLVLTGTANLDGTGNSIANILTGNSGDNVLDGGGGADILRGGAGDDTYIINDLASLPDDVLELAGEGSDTVLSSITYTLPANVENLTLTGPSNIAGTGNELANVIIGNARDNTLTGGEGDDILDGGPGTDTAKYGGPRDGYAITTQPDGSFRVADLRFGSPDGTDTLVNVEAMRFVDSVYRPVGNHAPVVIPIDTSIMWGQSVPLFSLFAVFDVEGDPIVAHRFDDLDAPGRISFSETGWDLTAASFLAGTTAGTDTLRVSVFDGTTWSDWAQVHITTVGNAPVVTATDRVLSLNSPPTFDNTLGGPVSYPVIGSPVVLDGNVSVRDAELDALNNGAGDYAGASVSLVIQGPSFGDVFGFSTAGAFTVSGNLLQSGGQTFATYNLPFNQFGFLTIAFTSSGTIATRALVDDVLEHITYTLTGSTPPATVQIDWSFSDGNTGAQGDGGALVANATTTVVLSDPLSSPTSVTLPQPIQALVLTGTANINGTGNALANTITGNSGDNSLSGNGDNDILDGGLGNDVLDGGLGNDVLNGGTGSDTASYASIGAGVTVSLSIVGPQDTGGAGADTLISIENLTGSALADTLTGDGEDNILDGGAGTDTMTGGTGNDTYRVDNTGDVVIERAAEGTDTVRSSVSYTLGPNVENLALEGLFLLINGTGNELANSITGNDWDNVIDGAGGADTMAGAFGNDTYFVDDPGDQVIENAGAGTDTIKVGFSYTLGANIENLVLTGAAGIDGTGNSLANTITGNPANNVLDGRGGIDTLIGGRGDDTYAVDQTGDVVIENVDEGTDDVVSSVTYALSANIERLTLVGSANIDGTGNALANVITGNVGNNTLDGRAGGDTMTGGLGDDTYVLDDIGDLVVENLDEGTDTVRSSITYALQSNLENLTLTGSSSIDGAGNELPNVVIGNDQAFEGAGANILIGGAGDDVLDGRTGVDILKGGTGNDTYVFSSSFGGPTSLILYRSPGVFLPSPSISTPSAFFSFNSDSGIFVPQLADFTGDGKIDWLTFSYRDFGFPAGPNDVSVQFGTWPLGSNLEPGTYELDGLPPDPQLFLGVNGSGGTVHSGSFTVSEAVFDYNGPTPILKSFSASFEIDIEATTAKWTGTLNYNYAPAGSPVADSVVENVDEGIDTVLSAITLTLPENVERLTLTGIAPSHGTGNNLDNLITGNSSDNVLAGGAGRDTLIGGDGDDTYVNDEPVADSLIENPDEGFDQVVSSFSYELPANIEKLTLVGSADIQGTGNELENILVGNAGNNVLSGNAGRDVLLGEAGSDTLDGGSDLDVLKGGVGNDTYIMGDVLVGGPNTLTMHSEPGEYVGAGQDYSFSSNTGTFVPSLFDKNQDGMIDYVSFMYQDFNYFDSPATHHWFSVTVSTGQLGINLTPGAYFDAQRAAFATPGHAGLEVSGDARGGDGLGRFVVLASDIDYSGPSPVLRNFSVDFEQETTSSLGARALSGTLNYSSDPSGSFVPDSVVENAGEGTDTALSSVTYTLPANVENLTLTGPGNIDGTGNELANIITGNAGNNTLAGGGGDDTLTGGGGNDTLNGGPGTDMAQYGGPRDGYAITTQPDGSFRVADLRVGSPDGTDTLVNVEAMRFVDSVYRPVGNHAPVVIPIDTSIMWGQSAPMSSLFTVSDPDGDPIVAHRFDDLGAPGRISFSETGSGLTATSFLAGTTAGTDTLRVSVFDGTTWSDWAQVHITTTVGNAPVVTAMDRVLSLNRPPTADTQTVAVNHSVAASSLFGAADPDGDAITQYEFQDVGAGAASGHFTLNGVTQPQGDASFAISSAQLGQLQYVGGSVASSEAVWVRASDSLAFGDWTRFVMSTEPNHGPVVTPTAGTLPVLSNRSVAASSLFSATDPDDDATTQYEFQDVGAGATSGHFTLNGVAQPQGDATFTVSAAQLGQLRYAGGSVASSEPVWVRASDGTTFGDWKRLVMSSESVYSGPAVLPKADAQIVLANRSVAAASLFAAIDPDGDTITQYEIQDVGAAATSGHFTLNGVAQPQGDATFAVSSAQLGQLQYAGGSVAGSEAVWVRASDGATFGDWKRFLIETEPDHGPMVTPAALTQTVLTNRSVAGSSLFSAADQDGDATTQYEFQDVGAGGGHFMLNGVAQPQGDATFTVTAAQLEQLLYTGGSVAGSEAVWVRASDGETFGDWKRFVMSTEPNHGPVVTPTAGTLPVLINRSVDASSLFSAVDPEGDATTQYEFQDVGAGGGHFMLNGVAQPQGDATFTVSAAQLPQLQYTGGSVAGSEAVWARASDGTNFGDWQRFVMSTLAA